MDTLYKNLSDVEAKKSLREIRNKIAESQKKADILQQKLNSNTSTFDFDFDEGSLSNIEHQKMILFDMKTRFSEDQFEKTTMSLSALFKNVDNIRYVYKCYGYSVPEWYLKCYAHQLKM